MSTELYPKTYGETWDEAIRLTPTSALIGTQETDTATEGVTPQVTQNIQIPNGSSIYYPNIYGGIFFSSTFKTADSGARIEIFPEYDRNIGLVAYDNQATPAEVFKVVIDGTDVGDVQIGNYSGGQGALWDKSAGTFTVVGNVTASSLAIGTSPNWFKADTSGNIWLGQDTLVNAQANTFAVTKAGVAYMRNIVISGLAAGSAVDLQYATNVTAVALSALSANLGTITAGNITLDTSGYIKGGQTAFDTGDQGFWFGYVNGAWKFSMAATATQRLTMDATGLTITGVINTLSKGNLSSRSATLFNVSGLNTALDVYRLRLRIIGNSAGTTPTILGLRFNNNSSANYYSKVNENGSIGTYDGYTSMRLNATGISDTASGVFDITFSRPNDETLSVTWIYTIFDQGVVYTASGGGAFDTAGTGGGDYTTITQVSVIVYSGDNFEIDCGWILEGNDLI